MATYQLIFILTCRKLLTLSITIHTLIYKLKNYGITGLANSLCASYLANRTHYVEFKNSQSKHTNMNVGVPQGSIMGPLLFIIYINDIIFSCNIFKFTLYADDTTLFTTIKSPDENNSHTQLINNELSKVTNWLLANKLSLNAAKTKFIVFSMPQNKINIPVLRLADSDIECVDSFNFLSITIDKHVNWVAHTNKVASRISRTTGVLNRLKNILPIYILKSIYTSLIMCHLNYGILVWGHTLNRLIIVPKIAVRIISCNKYIAHTEPIFKKLNLLKLEDIFKLHQLKFYYKITKMLLPS